MGQLKLKLKYFYNLTPREFSNTERGFRKYDDTLSKERIMLTRKIMWATAFPHLKDKITEQEIWLLPWDEVLDEYVMEEISAEESQKLIEEAEKVKEFYRIQDEKKKSQSI